MSKLQADAETLENIDRIVQFWSDLGPQGWYAQDDAVDAEIRTRFGAQWQEAAAGAFLDWGTTGKGALAYLLLTDQFPRNMFRGDARSFATDGMALAAAQRFVRDALDMAIEPPLRQFFYLPFMHAETRNNQDAGVCLFLTRMPGTDNLDHARAHRWVIRRFGRFPHRNAVLGRETSPAEQVFLDEGGYGAALRAVQAA